MRVKVRFWTAKKAVRVDVVGSMKLLPFFQTLPGECSFSGEMVKYRSERKKVVQLVLNKLKYRSITSTQRVMIGKALWVLDRWDDVMYEPLARRFNYESGVLCRRKSIPEPPFNTREVG